MNYSNEDIDQQQVIRSNIRDAITKAKRNGITGMSCLNLKMVTNTRGVHCSVQDFHAWFDLIAEQVAKDKGFDLYQDGLSDEAKAKMKASIQQAIS